MIKPEMDSVEPGGRLSVVVLTYNEARHIRACLESTRELADELLVFDSHSQDATRELARETGARICERTFDNYPNQRNAALQAASFKWVFFLDADERVEPPVAAEIRAIVNRSSADSKAPVLYWIPRKNYIFGKWIRHTGWSPDYQPRLMLKDRVHFDPARPVHELALADGPDAYLRQPLTHLNYETLEQFRRKQESYTRFEAEQLYAQGVRPRRRGLVGQPVREFLRRFIGLQGYKDGGHGLWLCLLMAHYAYRRQRMLAEMWREKQ